MARKTAKLLRPSQAADYLGISPRTLQNWIEKGTKIPCIIVGKRRMYAPERLDDWRLDRVRQVI